MRHPLVIALAAGLAVVVLALAIPLLHGLAGSRPAPTAPGELPWQVQPTPGGGIVVFGLALPGGTLDDAVRRWGDDLDIAVMARRGEGGALEAYVERFAAGGVTGRLVLSTETDAATVARWRARSPREQAVDADTRRYSLAEGDRVDALRTPLAGITFLPAARLDADTVRGRFGAPAERWSQDERIEQWLYPALGLAVAIDREGRDLLQYVAPADFDRRLRAPLVAAGAQRLE